MSATPRFEVPLGPVNGGNRIFQTSYPYVAGSVVVFLDGQAKRGDWDDGWIELGSGKIEMKLAPEIDSLVQVYYLVGG